MKRSQVSPDVKNNKDPHREDEEDEGGQLVDRVVLGGGNESKSVTWSQSYDREFRKIKYFLLL
jgi:hypothetical protein